jgi:hypothetical protein
MYLQACVKDVAIATLLLAIRQLCTTASGDVGTGSSLRSPILTPLMMIMHVARSAKWSGLAACWDSLAAFGTDNGSALLIAQVMGFCVKIRRARVVVFRC